MKKNIVHRRSYFPGILFGHDFLDVLENLNLKKIGPHPDYVTAVAQALATPTKITFQKNQLQVVSAT